MLVGIRVCGVKGLELTVRRLGPRVHSFRPTASQTVEDESREVRISGESVAALGFTVQRVLPNFGLKLLGVTIELSWAT